MLIIMSRLFNFYVYLPIVNTPPANQDVWILCIISGVLDAILCFPIMYLVINFKDLSLLDYYKLIIGKIPSFIWGIILAIFMLFQIIIAFNLVTIFLEKVIIPETPYLIMLVFIAIVCYYSVQKGFVVLGRVAEMIVPFIVFSVVFFTLLNIGNMNFKNLLPILSDSNWKDILFGSINISFRFYQIYFIAIFSPMLQDKKAVVNVFKCSLIILSILYTVMTITCIASFGVTLSQNYNFLYFSFMRQIDLFRFIERIEFIGVMGWLLGAFICISLHLFALLTLLNQTIKTQINSKIQLIIIFLIVIFVSKYTPISESYILSEIMSYKILPYIQSIFNIVIPSIICIIYLIRRKSIENKLAQKSQMPNSNQTN